MNGHCRLHSSALHAYIWHLRIRASSLQFRASKINMALALMDNLFKKLMSNPELHYYTAPNRSKSYPNDMNKNCLEELLDMTRRT